MLCFKMCIFHGPNHGFRAAATFSVYMEEWSPGNVTAITFPPLILPSPSKEKLKKDICETPYEMLFLNDYIMQK